jgi:hypothetical protein
MVASATRRSSVQGLTKTHTMKTSYKGKKCTFRQENIFFLATLSEGQPSGSKQLFVQDDFLSW